MDAAPRPPLLKRVPPGGWMAISWCAAIAYTSAPLVLTPPWGVSPWHSELAGLRMFASNISWAGLAMCGVVALSAVLLRRWPLPSLGLLLAATIAAASAPQPAASDASLLIAPAGVAVGFIAATRPRRVSIAAAVAAFGLLARYGTHWRGPGFWLGTADSWPAAIVIAWLIGQSVRQHRVDAETLRVQAEAGAVTAERLRVAGELQDMVARSIGVVAIQAGAGRRVIDSQPAKARDALSVIEATSRETLAGLRRTLGALRRAEPGLEAGQAPADPAPVRMGAAARPPLARRVLPGVWLAASWCAVIGYALSATAAGRVRWAVQVLTPRGPRPVSATLLGVLDGFGPPWPLLAMAGVVVLSAVLLRRWPLPALALLLAGAVAVSKMPAPTVITAPTDVQPVGPNPFLLIPPAGVAAGFIAATRPRAISIGAAATALGVLAWYTGGAMPPGFPSGTSVVLGVSVTSAMDVAVAIAVAWLVGQSIRQNRLHAATVNAQTEAGAATAERLRIARELHDVIAHSMGVIAIQAGVGRRVIDTQPAQARNALSVIEATSQETLAGLRHTLGAPRPAGPGPDPALAPLDPAPGLARIARLTATAMGAGVRVDVRWRGNRRPLPADIDLSAFRIIQEAVTNVIRHAGTGHCQVIIDQHDGELAIEVTDDGRGGPGDGTGYGIAGMRERADLVHGQLSAGPRPEGGFKVAARLPLPVPAGAR
jgi:signal transduction histidine kinase